MNPFLRLNHWNRLRFCAAFGAVSLLPFAPAVAEEPLKPVIMQLDWLHNVQFSGIYQAVEQGFFAEEGLDVEIRPVVRDQATVEAAMAAEGIVFGCAESNVILQGRAEGFPLVALATMFQDSPLGWMVLNPDEIRTPADFAGRTVGIHPDGDRVIRWVAAQSGLQPESVNAIRIPYGLDTLLNGEVDALQGYYIDEFVKLQQVLGADHPAAMIRASDYGYLAYSQVVFTSEAVLADHPGVVVAFLRALKRGWEYALENQAETVDLVLEKWNPELDRDYQLGSLNLIADLVTTGGTVPVLHPMERGRWATALSRYQAEGIITVEVDLSRLLPTPWNPEAE
jgi:ABC-type nitrate/sulfonate/bicarbonate transport system substrate-binding protein